MTEDFPDRREELFGRERDIHLLVDRARRPGLTAVVARPLMGKTWTLAEVARRLTEEGRFFVGYHEAKGGEVSHLLHAVANLYSRWLADSAMRDQAIILWERHKGELLPRVGQLVGALFQNLCKPLVPEGVAAVVRDCFAGLIEAHKDLTSGGLSLPQLPYSQALSLTALVAKISGRQITLVLDAWEKSPALRQEVTLLDSFLKDLDGWPSTHIMVAVRSPEVVVGQGTEPARIVRDLCRISRAAQVFDLGPMDLQAEREKSRLTSFVQQRIAGANDQESTKLIDMIAGYPGVVKFWIDASAGTPRSNYAEHLQLEADRAQSLRYLELERLLAELDGPILATAVRLALLPRLTFEAWRELKPIVQDGDREADIEALVDGRILEDAPTPTYGHDTRHSAALRWLMEHRTPLVRRLAERCVRRLAGEIQDWDAAGQVRGEALASMAVTCASLGLSRGARAACEAAQATPPSRDDFAFDSREFLQEVPAASLLLAQAISYRAATKADQRDPEGAIQDWTAAIDMPGAPAFIVSQALHGRGTMKGDLGDVEGKLADLNAAMAIPGIPPDVAADVLVQRGDTRVGMGDMDGAMSDFEAALAQGGLKVTTRANALNTRGYAKALNGDFAEAVADFTAVVEMKGTPVFQVGKALVNRGYAKGKQNDLAGAIEDFTSALEVPRIDPHWRADALIRRGMAQSSQGKVAEAIADYGVVVASTTAPVDAVAKALLLRGWEKAVQGDFDGHIADATVAIELPGLGPDLVVEALLDRAATKGLKGDLTGEIEDYGVAITLPGRIDQIAKALLQRSAAKRKLDDLEGEQSDLSELLMLRGVPGDLRAAALSSRRRDPLEEILRAAVSEARVRRHVACDVEHLLFAVVAHARSAPVLEACGVRAEELHSKLIVLLDARDVVERDGLREPTQSVYELVQRAIMHGSADGGGKSKANAAHLFAAILSDDQARTAQILKECGVDRDLLAEHINTWSVFTQEAEDCVIDYFRKHRRRVALGVGDLLLAILEDSSTNLVLHRCGIPPDKVREPVTAFVANCAVGTNDSPWTKLETTKELERAVENALRQWWVPGGGKTPLTGATLLAGILADADAYPTTLLQGLGVTAEKVNAWIKDLSGKHP